MAIEQKSSNRPSVDSIVKKNLTFSMGFDELVSKLVRLKLKKGNTQRRFSREKAWKEGATRATFFANILRIHVFCNNRA